MATTHYSSDGTTLSIHVRVIDDTGAHVDPDGWSADPDSADLEIVEQPSAIHSGTKIGVGEYDFTWTGLTAIAENTVVHVKINGEISAVAWSEWIEEVQVLRIPLRPTTPGNTLDVSAAGNAGIDWSNVENPTTTLGLSGTTIKTATDIETKVDTIDDFVDTEIAAIKAKTDNLPTDPADQSAVEAAISASQAAMTILLNAIAGYIDTEVAAIKAKTDNLPTDPADASDITASFASVSATLTTIASYIDTEIAAIKAKTDNLPSDPADQSALEALLSTITTELAKVHKSGQTRRYTQIAVNAGAKTADVSLGDPL